MSFATSSKQRIEIIDLTRVEVNFVQFNEVLDNIQITVQYGINIVPNIPFVVTVYFGFVK